MTAAHTPPSIPHRRLSELASTIFVGLAASRRTTATSESAVRVPLINVRDIEDGRVAPMSTLEGRSLPGEYNADRYRVQSADVLLTCRGSRLKIACVPDEAAGAVISSNLIAVRLGTEMLPPVLLAYLESSRGRAALLSLGQSSTGAIALSPRSVAQLEIPVPPPAVQDRIAELVRAAEENFVTAVTAAEQRRMVAREVALALLTGSGTEHPREDN